MDIDTDASTELKTHRGSCHCQAVRFEVRADLSQGASRCNCTICTKIGGTGIIVKPDALMVLSGEGELGTYAWGGMISRRYFCRRCGIRDQPWPIFVAAVASAA